MAWHVTLSRASDALAFGEVELATGRTFRKALNQPTSVGFTVPRDYHLSPRLQEGIKTLAHVLQSDHADPAAGRFKRWHQGPINKVEKVVGQDGRGSLAVTGASPYWYLARRQLGQSNAGVSYADALTQIDRTQIGAQVLAAANVAGYTGIDIGDTETTVDTFAGPWRYKPASEALTDLSAPLDGFDHELEYVEPNVTVDGLQLALLHLRARLGADRQTTAIFEYGTGRHNVTGFRQVTDFDQMANRVVDLPSGFPQEGDEAIGPVLTVEDTASQAEWGLLEAVVQAVGEVEQYRQALLGEQLAIRSAPRQIITFTLPTEWAGSDGDGLLRFGADYDVGDVVRFRAVEKFEVRDTNGTVTGYAEQITVDADFRLYGVECQIADRGGAMTPQVALVEEGA